MTIAALMRQLLTSDGITCHSAQNGNDALALTRELKPDVLVLDVQMPGMSGFEVLSAVKADPATASPGRFNRNGQAAAPSPTSRRNSRRL